MKAKHLLFLLLFCVGFISCSDDFEDINIENRSDNIRSQSDPEYPIYGSHIPRVYDSKGVLEVVPNYYPTSIYVILPPVGHNTIKFTAKNPSNYYTETDCLGINVFIQGCFRNDRNDPMNSGIYYPYERDLIQLDENGIAKVDITRAASNSPTFEDSGWNEIYLELRSAGVIVNWETYKRPQSRDPDPIYDNYVWVTYQCTFCSYSEMLSIPKTDYNSGIYKQINKYCPYCYCYCAQGL